MTFDERYFQMFDVNKSFTPDGVLSNSQIEKFFQQILGELIAMSAYKNRLPCKSVLRIANYVSDEVRNLTDLNDAIFALSAIIFGLLRERVAIQPEVTVASHLNDIFDEDLKAQLSLELAAIPYFNFGNNECGFVTQVADYASLSIFGKRFELQIELDDDIIEFDIVDDPSSEFRKIEPQDDGPEPDDSEKPDEPY